jgi:hypothetical protein
LQANRAAKQTEAVYSKQEAPLVENPATALQDVFKQTMRDNDSNKGFDFSSATANVRAYPSKAAGNGTSQHAICF